MKTWVKYTYFWMTKGKYRADEMAVFLDGSTAKPWPRSQLYKGQELMPLQDFINILLPKRS